MDQCVLERSSWTETTADDANDSMTSSRAKDEGTEDAATWPDRVCLRFVIFGGNSLVVDRVAGELVERVRT